MNDEVAKSKVFRPEASWRRMLITHSPIRKLTELRTLGSRQATLICMGSLEFSREPVPLDRREVDVGVVNSNKVLNFEETEGSQENIEERMSEEEHPLDEESNQGQKGTKNTQTRKSLIGATKSMGCRENGQWAHGMTMVNIKRSLSRKSNMLTPFKGAYYSILFERMDWRPSKAAPGTSRPACWKLFPGRTITHRDRFIDYWYIQPSSRPG